MTDPNIRYTVVPEISQGQSKAAVVTAVPGSRLEELLAGYETAKAALEDAKARYDALTDALKSEMSTAVPQAGHTSIILAAMNSSLPRLRMNWKTPYRFDVRRFRAENPVLYVQYETRGGHWELRQDG